jgi:hypothetical protein
MGGWRSNQGRSSGKAELLVLQDADDTTARTLLTELR